MSERKGIMLCYPFDEKRLAKWGSLYLLQPKLDGERCRAIVDADGKATLLSSEEHIFTRVPHIIEEIEKLHLRSVELDGELYIHGADFSSIHSIVSRKQNLHPDHMLMEYHIFDIVSELPQAKRIEQLIDTIPCRYAGRNYGPLQVVQTRIATSLEDIMKAMDDYQKNAYEGFIVRDPYASYVRKRSTQIMKFKPRKEDIYEITGCVEEISKDGVPKMALGALICRGDDGTLFNVGSGSFLTRENRQVYWESRDSLPGKWAKIKYQHLTHGRGVPRFPVLVDVIDNPIVG